MIRAMHPSSEDVARIFREIGEKSQFVLSAVENRLLVPYFQPIVSTLNGELEAVEVLSRIPSEDGVFEAGQFIELAERMGVIHKLDYIILDKALEEVKRTGYSGLVFVNLSPRALVLNQFLDEVVSIVKRHGVDPSRLVFEMTERETIRNIKLLSKFVVALKLEGFKLAIDDFGSGFSSYNYLKHFPIDFLKIEGEFVRNAVKSEKDARFTPSANSSRTQRPWRSLAGSALPTVRGGTSASRLRASTTSPDIIRTAVHASPWREAILEIML